MVPHLLTRVLSLALAAMLLLPSCSMPTLVTVARSRQAPGAGGKSRTGASNDMTVAYHIADLDVLNYTDAVKRKLGRRFNFDSGTARAAGSAAGTTKGTGTAGTNSSNTGKATGSQGSAQTYQRAFASIQAAEAAFIQHQVGNNSASGADHGARIPSPDRLTADGQALYSRVTEILNDLLARKGTDGRDSKTPPPAPVAGGKPDGTPKAPPPHPEPPPVDDSKTLRTYWKPDGRTVDAKHAQALDEWLKTNAAGLDIGTLIYSPADAGIRAKAVKALPTFPK